MKPTFGAEFATHVGKAAEHIVCADLLLSGYRCCLLNDEGLPYDIIVDNNGKPVRIQVKATQQPKNVNSKGKNARIAYSWNVRRRGRYGSARLTNTECDIIALVALDIKRVAYLGIGQCSQTVYMEPLGAVPRPTTNNRIYYGRAMTDYTLKEAMAA